MAEFLSQAWFDELKRLNTEAGELNLSPNLASLLINVRVADQAGGQIDLFLKNGKLHQGSYDDAHSTIIVDRATLFDIASGMDTDKALEAFMTGKIRVEGDMSKVLALQTAKPSPEQKVLYKQILAMSDFD